MSTLGDIRKTNPKAKHIWAACETCGKARWAVLIRGKAASKLCLSCAGKLTHARRNAARTIPNTPPTIGEVRRGWQLGRAKDKKHPYEYVRCPDCGKERWVSVRGNRRTPGLCQQCSAKRQSGPKNPRWTGSLKHSQGYRLVWISPDDHFRQMATRGYVSEHRLVMARHMNRCLLPWEIVHHKNGDRLDNRIENLVLLGGRKDHLTDTVIKSLVAKQNAYIIYLESLLTSNGIKFRKKMKCYPCHSAIHGLREAK